jgi:hypothetical protein
MAKTIRAAWFLFVPGLLAGCGGPILPPPANQVAEVRLSVIRFPKESGGRTTCEVTLTQPADIAEVMDWLGKIDWSQKGTDVQTLSLPQADASVILTTKGGASRYFNVYWDGGFVDGVSNRFLKGGDMARFRAVAEKACR